VFEVSQELNRSLDEPSIFRVLTTTVMGQVFVGLATVLTNVDGRVEPVIARGFDYTAAEREELSGLEFDLLRDAMAEGHRPPALERIIERTGLSEFIPLRTGDSVAAVMGLGGRLDGRGLGDEDRAFVRTLGEQALVARDNLRMHLEMIIKQRMERELSIAREIQTELLPSRAPTLEGYTLLASAQPCFEVGGDYYDFLEGPEGLVLSLGDVVGKSVPAALMMASVHASLRALATQPGLGLADLMSSLNSLMARSVKPGRFVTLFTGRLEPRSGVLHYVNAGHNPPLRIDRQGRVTRLEEGGLVIGVMDQVSYREGTLQLEPGDLLVLYTDGVTESMSPEEEEEEFGEERLIEALRKLHDQPLGSLLEAVLNRLETFRGGQPASDDTTLVLLRRN
jgi:sigma-B regulation protein RsbU (phosphoserine phosphatase)